MVMFANSLRLMQINVQGIRTVGRVEELHQLLKRHDVHVEIMVKCKRRMLRVINVYCHPVS